MECQARVELIQVENRPGIEAQGYGNNLFVKEGRVVSISADGKTITVEKITITCLPIKGSDSPQPGSS